MVGVAGYHRFHSGWGGRIITEEADRRNVYQEPLDYCHDDDRRGGFAGAGRMGGKERAVDGTTGPWRRTGCWLRTGFGPDSRFEPIRIHDYGRPLCRAYPRNRSQIFIPVVYPCDRGQRTARIERSITEASQ